MENSNHRNHPLEWRLEDFCLMCLVETIESGSGLMQVHRRFALLTLNQRLGHDQSTSNLHTAARLNDKALVKLLKKNHIISTKVLAAILGTVDESLLPSFSFAVLQKLQWLIYPIYSICAADALTSKDIVDLAIDAVYRFYYHALREQACLNSILSHCIQKVLTAQVSFKCVQNPKSLML